MTFTCTPSECSPVTGPKLLSFMFFAPRRGVFPRWYRQSGKQPKRGLMAFATVTHFEVRRSGAVGNSLKVRLRRFTPNLPNVSSLQIFFRTEEYATYSKLEGLR